MPGFNGKGPEGKGSGTGRGLGRCKPSIKENTQKSDDLKEMEYPEQGRGMGMRRGNGACGKGQGRGRGRGFGNRQDS